MNIINSTDFYKPKHADMFPEGSEFVYDNFTPRSVQYAQTKKITVLGIQSLVLKRFIKEFNDTFFCMDEDKAVRKYGRRMDNALGKGAVDTKYIRELHQLQYLPIHLKALPEGVEVNPKVPVLTITNTLKAFYWLPNYLETVSSSELWIPMTSASIAREFKRTLMKYALMTGTPSEVVNIQGHDFSARGMYPEAGAASGFGHLTSFAGTDTIPAIDFAEDWYFADSDKELVGCSVPSTEHSVMCMGGQDTEIDTFKRLLDLVPKGVISIVSDTWDFWKVMTEFAPQLKDQIRARKPIYSYDFYDLSRAGSYEIQEAMNSGHTVFKLTNGTFYDNLLGETIDAPTVVIPAKCVFRPDSGCPVKILTGYTEDEYEVVNQKRYAFLDNGELSDTPLMNCEVLGAVEVLWDSFGGSITDKGYKQLEEVGLIYGDSITLERAEQILSRLEEKGFASGNVVLGIGSYTYQMNTRDTYGFAMKATWGQVNNEGREIMKDPKTDDGTKKSLKGLLRVELENGEYVAYDQQTPEQEKQGELKTVFLNGVLTRKTTLEEIRARINEEYKV